MEALSPQQLELLIYLFVGLTALTLVALFIYVAISMRRRPNRLGIISPDAEDLALRPSFLTVGEVLALVRDQVGQPLQVRIKDVKYQSLAEVEDPRTKRQILDAALELIQFTGVLGGGEVALTPVEKTETWREDLRQDSDTELERVRRSSADGSSKSPPASEEIEKRFLSLLNQMGQAASQPEKPDLVSSVQRVLRPKPGDSRAARSFVDDIDEIVQRRIGLVPALTGRGLHVRSDPTGKVLFTFEGQEYQSVDDISNLTARQIVKDAIQEWEETN
jgi:hypothetical protein